LEEAVRLRDDDDIRRRRKGRRKEVNGDCRKL